MLISVCISFVQLFPVNFTHLCTDLHPNSLNYMYTTGRVATVFKISRCIALIYIIEKLKENGQTNNIHFVFLLLRFAEQIN